MKTKCNYLSIPKITIKKIVHKFKISPYISILLLSYKIITIKKIKNVLKLIPKVLLEPFKINYMLKSILRIIEAIEKKEQIIILGDYDVDGITSTSLLINILKLFNIPTLFFIPNRFKEGYGLTIKIIKSIFLKKNIKNQLLFIALDCGTNAQKEIHLLKNLKIDFIIIDHHINKKIFKIKHLIINPHKFHNNKYSEYCTVGLIFKMIHGIIKILIKKKNYHIDKNCSLNLFFELAAIGTIADLALLHQENTIIIKYGLNKLSFSKNVGINALINISNIDIHHQIKYKEISYKMAPRINASGRLNNANIAVKLLTNNTKKYCYQIAINLNKMNKIRQYYEHIITVKAKQIINSQKYIYNIIILYYSYWHAGILGIVAGKITSQFYRPSIILNKKDNLLQGSGRSIKNINLINILYSCNHLLNSWGGHPMALGLSLNINNFKAFNVLANKSILKQTNNNFQIFEKKISIAHNIKKNELYNIYYEGIQNLLKSRLENPEAIFQMKKVIISNNPTRFKNGHLKYKIFINANNHKKEYLYGIYWNPSLNLPLNTPINIIFKYALFPSQFSWKNPLTKNNIQITLIDWSFYKKIL